MHEGSLQYSEVDPLENGNKDMNGDAFTGTGEYLDAVHRRSLLAQ